MKKLLSVLLAILIVSTVSVTAMAAQAITKEDAQSIALRDAGYAADEVLRLKVRYEFDDGRAVYNVDFLVEAENGLYKDYDYEISAETGRIIERDWDYERVNLIFDGSLFDALKARFAAFVEWLKSLFSFIK